MNETTQLVADYAAGVNFPRVSGFEILELLDVRSRLVGAEPQLSASEQEQLERADEIFLAHAGEFYEQIAEVANLKEMRQRAAIPSSHWWWHLEKLPRRVKAVASA